MLTCQVALICTLSHSIAMSGIDACIKVAQLTAAAGEMAPFPFIKGAAECVVLVLESIKGVSKNKKDMQELAESIVAILADIRDTIIEHGPTSATRFQTICVEYQTRITDLLSELNSKRRSPQGIWKYLRATKVSDDINDLQQRIRAIQKSFLVRTATMTQLAVSDVQDQVAAGFSTLTGSVEASERQITSTIKENIDEIRTLGARQSENMENLSTRLLQASHQRGLYKGLVWDFIPGDIRIIKPATRSLGSYCTTRTVTYKDSYGTVENSDTWKIIREYQALGDNGEDAMKQLDKALDIFMKLKRHPNVAQIFGVCRSPNLPVIIFHGTTRVPFSHYQHNLTAKRFLPFYYELIQDLRVCLARVPWATVQELFLQSVLKFWPRSLSRTCTTYPVSSFVNDFPVY
ncbi:uncharacterized protein BT62DRAFT_135624 [Guyanagaster necrorhizus]|uniref:Fungal N-terminal domain-containing protein n=1 Tax=Guyanagaster necrorhizus TaxID=856835 RepID=A0A9P8AKV5_9AGAR|nr:uncharacterized protein BT62DRAFT_135624 [Guyanagaster necrorhizus MCA 3950]KAG7439069.1 hypothetical protein BT62DRAFT_135624 [Guyanagaster necrorhizus MCA 3950]